MESVKKGLQLSKISLTNEIVKKNGWGSIVEAGQFDLEKALMSLQATSKKFLDNLEIHKIEDVLEKPTCSLGTLKKYRGEIQMKVVLHHFLYQVSNFFNVVRNFSDYQIEMLCDLIYEDFHYLQISDFKLCFKRGMAGKYGKIYDRLDGEIIMGWLQKYADERANLLARRGEHERKLQEQKKIEEISNGTCMPGWFEEFLQKFTPSYKKNVCPSELRDDPGIIEMIEQKFNMEEPCCGFETFVELELLSLSKMLNQKK